MLKYLLVVLIFNLMIESVGSQNTNLVKELKKDMNEIEKVEKNYDIVMNDISIKVSDFLNKVKAIEEDYLLGIKNNSKISPFKKDIHIRTVKRLLDMYSNLTNALEYHTKITQDEILRVASHTSSVRDYYQIKSQVIESGIQSLSSKQAKSAIDSVDLQSKEIQYKITKEIERHLEKFFITYLDFYENILNNTENVQRMTASLYNSLKKISSINDALSLGHEDEILVLLERDFVYISQNLLESSLIKSLNELDVQVKNLEKSINHGIKKKE